MEGEQQWRNGRLLCGSDCLHFRSSSSLPSCRRLKPPPANARGHCASPRGSPRTLPARHPQERNVNEEADGAGRSRKEPSGWLRFVHRLAAGLQRAGSGDNVTLASFNTRWHAVRSMKMYVLWGLLWDAQPKKIKLFILFLLLSILSTHPAYTDKNVWIWMIQKSLGAQIHTLIIAEK